MGEPDGDGIHTWDGQQWICPDCGDCHQHSPDRCGCWCHEEVGTGPVRMGHQYQRPGPGDI